MTLRSIVLPAASKIFHIGEKNGKAYAWILSRSVAYERPIQIQREGRRPYHMVEDSVLNGAKYKPIDFQAERLDLSSWATLC